MASSNDPMKPVTSAQPPAAAAGALDARAEGEQAGAPESAPEPKAPLTPELLGEEMARLDRGLVGLVFLATTVYLLVGQPDPDRPVADGDRVVGPSRWWLVPLFAAWANLDNWFLLGPLTVAAYLAGETGQYFFVRPESGQDPRRKA